MSKLYARTVRLSLTASRTAGLTFPDAWTRAMRAHPAPEDWGSTAQTQGEESPLAHMRRLYSLAYLRVGETVALSDDLLPAAKDIGPRPERTTCRSRCVEAPLPGDTFCAEHRAILDRVRVELEDDGQPVSRHRIVEAA